MSKRITMLFLVISTHVFCSDSQDLKKMTRNEVGAWYERLNNIKIHSFGYSATMGNVDSATSMNWFYKINEVLNSGFLSFHEEENLRKKKHYILEEIKRLAADELLRMKSS